MAQTITRPDMAYVSFPITKMEETDEGIYVYGKATDGSVDSDAQIVDPAWSGPALAKWLRTGGNVRVQHNPQLYPAGRGVSVELDKDGDGGHYVKSLIVEDTAKKLVRAGVLRAYSVGIARPLIERDITGKARGGIVRGNDETEIAELSLVDRPANRECGISLIKSAGSDGPWTYGDLTALLAKAEQADTAAEAVPDLTKDGDKPNDKADDDSAGDDADDPGTLTDPSDPGDPDDDSTPESKADEDDDKATKAYIEAVALHKAAEPGPAGAALTGTEFLAKAAAWERWSAAGEADGLDGTQAGYAKWLAKRNIDPDVGGGVDRDKIPDADHVDPKGRRFPIVSPGDVSDAVSSYGRAKPLIPMPKFRKRLTSIAHRKGADYVAQLPDKWTSKAAEPYHRGPDETVKCPNCDKYNAPDARFCDQCGHALGAVTKDITLTSPDPSGLVPYNLAGQGDDTVKGGRKCPECGKGLPTDLTSRRCPECGAKLPKGFMSKIDKGRRPLPADTRPAGPHREPDGDAVELFEHDAGMPTTPDPTPDDIPESVKGVGEAYVVKRTHDAVCAAYGWDAVAAEYPALKGVQDVCTPSWWSEQLDEALGADDMTGVAFLATAVDTVKALAATEPAVLADVHAELHKAFSDMYPTAHLSPGNITPGQFQRPYIRAGHASPNATNGVTPTVPPSSHTISPDQYDRPLITAGHQAESPGDRGDNNPVASVASGAARNIYSAAAKAAADQAMKAVHDHIQTTFPDMCPLAPSRVMVPAGLHATSVPVSTRMPGLPAAPGEKSGGDVDLAKMLKAARKAAKRAEKAAARIEVDTLTKSADSALVADYQTQIAALQKQVDELGAQPDPAQAPLRGVLGKQAAGNGDVAPVEKRNLLAEAQEAKHAADQAEYIGFLRMMTKSADPSRREQAEDLLAGLLAK